MIKRTTPRIKCTIPPDMPLDYVLLTFKQNGIKLEKKILAGNIEDGVFYVTLTQEESQQFKIGFPIEVQVNIMSGSTRLASRVLQIEATKNLHDEIIGDDPGGQTLEITENGKYATEGYQFVDVHVQGTSPTGTLEIDTNGEYDVVDFAKVNVQVPGFQPTGSLEITDNGIYDVEQYAEAIVNVPKGLEETKLWENPDPQPTERILTSVAAQETLEYRLLKIVYSTFTSNGQGTPLIKEAYFKPETVTTYINLVGFSKTEIMTKYTRGAAKNAADQTIMFTKAIKIPTGNTYTYAEEPEAIIPLEIYGLR